MIRSHCSCTPTRRRWLDDGTCSRCGLTVHETSIMYAVKAVLIEDPACLLWRNEIGHNTHFPDGKRRNHPIEYGVCNPGGADLLGCYGERILAVETKTVKGSLSPEQIEFGTRIAQRRGIYAVVRSEADARELLQWLRGAAPRPSFVFAPPTGVQ